MATIQDQRIRPRDLFFPLALALAHSILWYVAIHREGAWRQVPAIDESHDLRTAWLLYRALTAANISAFVDAWAHASPVHTPLVPFASAILMLGFGESRVIAESVLPLFTAMWLVATYLVIYRLYDVATARWTTALASAFPVFLIYSRTYLFEHPLAALFAWTCLALLSTRGFSDRWASLGFGLLAGLTALARGGGAVFLVGPVVVALASGRKEPDWPRRVRNFLMAMCAMAAIAATWYGPNLGQFADYVFRATYGDEAVMRTGGGSAFSFDSAQYYLTWLIAQGPGVPMVCVAAIAWILSGAPGIARRLSPPSKALTIVFVIDAVLLLLGAQRVGARYFQPLMPLVALAISRSVLSVPQLVLQRVIAASVVLLAAHHVISLSLSVPPNSSPSAAPYVHGLPLWDHRPYFSSQVDYYRLRTPQDDFRIPATIDFLSRLNLPRGAVIGTISTLHAFFQPNGLQFEAMRRHLEWTFVWSPALDPADPGQILPSIPATPADAILFRFGGPTGIAPPNLESDSLEPALRRFRYAGRLELGDGSAVLVLVNRAS